MYDKRTCNDASLKYLAVAIADFLTEGMTCDEIRKVYALVSLISHNIQATLIWEGIRITNINNNT